MSLSKCLQQNFTRIKRELQPVEPIANFLYRERVIDESQYNMICEVNTDRNRAERLLWSLDCSRTMNEEETMDKIKTALRRNGSENLLGYFATASPDEEMVDLLFPGDIVRRTIDEKREKLNEDLEPSVCIDRLVDRGVLSIAYHKRIKDQQSRESKVRYLIERILTNPARHFTIFCQEMIDEDLINQLKETATRKMHEPAPSMSIPQHIQVQEIDRRNMEEPMEHGEFEIRYGGPGFDNADMMQDNIVQINTDQAPLRDEVNQLGLEFRNLSLGSILLKLRTRSPKAKKNILVECKKSPQFLQRLLQKCLTDECMKKLRRMKVQKVDIEISDAFPNRACCRSKLTKALVEKNVSYLEDHLEQVDVLAKTLIDAGFDYSFSTCLDEDSTPKDIIARFLKILIRDVSIYQDHVFCLLEMALKATGQIDLLHRITLSATAANITTEVIGKNQELLQNEIEPKLFLKMLDTIPGGGAVCEDILSCKTRKGRSQKLIDFVIKSGQATVETFISALEEEGLSYIVNAIKESENKMNRISLEDKEEWRDSLLSFSEEILGEVDPRQLCPVLKEKGLINEKENADLTSSDIIDRTWLTKQARVLRNVPDFVECIQRAGYTQLADDIRAEKERCSACPQHSPTSSNKSVVLKRTYTIIYNDSEDSKEPQGTTIELVLMENHTDTAFVIDVGEVTFKEKDQVCEALVNILNGGPWSDSEFCGLTEREYTAIKVKLKMLIGDLLEDDQIVVSAAVDTTSSVIIKVRSETPASVQRLRKKLVSPEIQGIMDPLQTILRKTFSESLTIKAVPEPMEYIEASHNRSRSRRGLSRRESSMPEDRPTPICFQKMPLRRCLQQNFTKIKRELQPVEPFAYSLYGERVIDISQYDMICAAKTDLIKAERLLWSLDCSPTIHEEGTMDKITKALRRNGSENLLGYFTDASQDEEMVEPLFPDDIVKRTIDEERELLKEELEPHGCIDQLVDHGVLSIADHRSIKEQSRIHKVEYLIERILNNPARNFKFCCEYEETIGRWLIGRLKETATRIMNEPVPSRPIQQNIQVQEIDRRKTEEPMDHAQIDMRLSFPDCDDVDMMEDNIAKIDQDQTPPREQLYQIGVTLENISIGSIILKSRTRSPKAKRNLLVECKMSTKFLQRHLQNCLTDECLKRLREMSVRKVDIDVSVAFPESACCRSKLTKALVEKNVSYLEDHLEQVDVLAKTLDGAGFGYDFFSTCLDEDSTPKEMNARFLKILIKDVSIDEDLVFCLLETALKATGQIELLHRIALPEVDISTEDIGKHQQLLHNEIEPRLFLEMLDTIPGGAAVRTHILSCESRRQRSKIFVDFVTKSGQTTVETFITALEEEGLSYIVNAIKKPEDNMNRMDLEDKEEWRDSLMSFSEEIVGEVDPRQLCPVLKEKGLINEKEIADLTSSDSINRIWLMKQARVLHNVPVFVECIQRAGYTQLADDIRAEKERCGACPQHSPTGSNKSVALKHSYTIIYHDSEDSKEPHGTTVELVLKENPTDTAFGIDMGAANTQQVYDASKVLVNILNPGPRSDSEFCGLTERNYMAIKVKMKMLIGDLLEDDQTVVSAAAKRCLDSGVVIITVGSETLSSVQRLRKKWFSPEIQGIMDPLQAILRETFSESLTIKAVSEKLEDSSQEPSKYFPMVSLRRSDSEELEDSSEGPVDSSDRDIGREENKTESIEGIQEVVEKFQ